tara:strand:- start:669 stop:1199 length:531 start_codon:yes stop_codon:yes gene_type:complete
MSLNDEIAEFEKLQREKQQEMMTPGCVWATVKEVDWDGKTMTAIGVEDDLEYYDVQLGLGAYYRKPVVDSKVMLGVPELQKNETFLIECEAFEEAIYVSGDTTFVIKKEGFIINQGNENLKDVWNDYFAQFGKLCDELNKVVVSVGVTPNVPAITAIKTEVTTNLKQRLNTILKDL